MYLLSDYAFGKNFTGELIAGYSLVIVVLNVDLLVFFHLYVYIVILIVVRVAVVHPFVIQSRHVQFWYQYIAKP